MDIEVANVVRLGLNTRTDISDILYSRWPWRILGVNVLAGSSNLTFPLVEGSTSK